MNGSQLKQYITKLNQQSNLIDPQRQMQLDALIELIYTELQENDICRVMAICTHNSRRSQLMESWLIAAAQYFNIDGIAAFSGGTEATAFNIRMILALRHTGFHLQEHTKGENPQYELTPLIPKAMGHKMFSKKFDDSFNPQNNFIAIMVCSDADQKCPIVLGAKHRISLPYDDPKEYDDTPMEHQMYMETVDEIGREIVYVMKGVSKK